MDYLSVLGLQLKINLDSNSFNEFLIRNKEFDKQFDNVKLLIENKNPDVIILPEMCYQSDLRDYYKDLSKDKLIVAGNIYNNGINYTIVFSKGDMFSIKKRNASGAEPMVRFIKDSNGNSFMSEYLSEHIFEINDKKLVVLNCMEYYKQAYYIARSIPDLFGIICICSNNNVGVFLDETKAIHNHNENIYTFMINSVNIYMGKKYALGESYVYGPIQGHEKEWLVKEGISMDEQGSDEEYFYGEFMSDFSRFGRSDNYVNSPKSIEVGLIRKRVLK